MLNNYFRIARRQIARSRFHSIINVIGLSTGIAFTLLVAAYVWSEYQVNRDLRHADRQFFLTSKWKQPGTGGEFTTLGPLAKALRENYPGLVANYYRWDGVTSNVSLGDKHFREGLQIGDSTLLTMYGFPLLYGDARTAFDNPYSVVITEEKALKYFGRADVVGKDLTIESFSGSKKDFRITGVLETPQRNSVTILLGDDGNQFFIPSTCLSFFGRNMDWPSMHIPNYVELQKGITAADLKEPLRHLIQLNAPRPLAANLEVVPVPLETYYRLGFGGIVQRMLYTLSFVAFFILAMAIVNFINISVSRSSSRMKEIGVRKVLGSLRRQLIIQFLTESVLLVLLATGFSLLLYQLFAPWFAGILGKKIPALSTLPWYYWVSLPVFALLLGSAAGLYPALVLSAMPSVDSLKGGRASVKENILLRKGLVSFQFATATVVFVGALIISQQISLFFSKELGYDKDFIVSAQLPRNWSLPGVQHMETVRQEFAALPGVKDIALSFEIPNGNNSGSIGIYRPGQDTTRAIVAQRLIADQHYGSTYQIPMTAGAFFNRVGESAAGDSMRVVINETAARALGWQDAAAAIGQPIKFLGFSSQTFTVSGVTHDFHFNAMGAAIQPSAFVHVELAAMYRYLSFKLRPGNTAERMEELQKKWAALLPGAAFEYQFMDETLAKLYRNELQLKKAASTATILAAIIVLLGVLGMVSISVQKRTKEIAIRKVIGASIPGIIRLFIREFVPLLIVAGLVASPLAYFIMQRWLNDYATRITITPWPFALAIICLGMVMALLIVVQTVRAALANPVKSLKTD
ncbi:MAG TPA: ABC transporter permease [Puia sp.]|nr:ABC transporter permease [Puia sp.]